MKYDLFSRRGRNGDPMLPAPAPEGYTTAPFDLNAAVPGAEVITRNGRRGRVVTHCDWLNSNNQLIVAIRINSNFENQLRYYYKTGKQAATRWPEAPSDLFMLVPKPVPVEYWANLYPCPGYAPITYLYESEEQADKGHRGRNAERIGGKAHKLVVG